MGFLIKVFARMKQKQTPDILREKHFHYDDCLNTFKRPCYLDGYWQSERYFKDFAEELERVLKSKKIENSDPELIKSLKKQNSIALHVRRSDYLHKANKNLFHLCSLDYYKAAVKGD